ncbi:RimK-like ATP-grasp domain protein [Snodgrassella alvi SCGC AB-598-O02]|nr:RimK-like ATP-grasp domain protein [Snodgrassella alvi SCGC AB-598-O02]
MKTDILILSSLYDFSTDLITQSLEKEKVSYLRLNKESFSDYRISLDPINIKMVVNIAEKKYVFDSGLKSILYRQPVFLRNTPNKKLSIDEQLYKSQWMAFLRSLLIFSQARWMNNPVDTYLSETKAFQLMLAKKLGFLLPKTLIGNNLEKFKTFKNEVIIKSLDTVLLIEKDDCLFTYSSLLDIHKIKEEEIYNVPLTVQEYIFPKIDIRVTIVGNYIFSVKITSKNQGIKEDWRTKSRDELEYTDIILPDDLIEKCFLLMKSLRLNFGAIDLIKQDNKYFFIEINPTGEWGWLVDERRRIDKVIANWLIGNDL